MFMHKHLNFFSRTLVVFITCAIFLTSVPFVNAQEIPIGPNGLPSLDAAAAASEAEAARLRELSAAEFTAGIGLPGGTSAGSEIPNLTTSVDETSSIIYNTSVRLAGFIASLGGGIFDGAVQKVVLKMGCWFRSPDQGYFQGGCSDTVGARGAVGGVVNELWSVVRDLFNILFIFALVWIGLRMILFADDSGTQRTLGMLIAAALLINFSLYFTKTIVDVANYTAVAIHAVAVGGLEGQFGFQVGQLNKDGTISGIDYDGDPTGGSDVGYSPSEASLASAYMQALRISSWFSGAPLTSIWEVIVYSLILLLFSIILGITLAFGGIMLITRFIALVILMIFSPAMFLGWVLPGFQKHASMWWDKFLSYAFFAPAYIFMLYLGLYTLIQLNNMVGDGTYADALSGEWKSEMFTIFLFYALGIGFLFAATKVGHSMSIAGSTLAMNTTQGALRRMRNGAVNIGLAGPRALGRGAKWGAGRGFSSMTGNFHQGTLDKLDAQERRTGTTTPWSRTRRAWAEKGQSKQYGGASSFKERKDTRKSANTRAVGAQRASQLQDTIIAGAGADLSTPAGQAAAIAMENALSNAGHSDLVALTKSDAGVAALASAAGSIPEAKWNKLMESDDVNPNTHGSLSQGRINSTNLNIARRGNPNITAADPNLQQEAVNNLGRASADEINAADFEATVLPNSWRIQSKQIDDLTKKWNSPTKTRLLKNTQEQQMLNMFDNGQELQLLNSRRGEEEMAKLPSEIFTDPQRRDRFLNAVINGGTNVPMTAGLLESLAKNKSIDGGTKREIGEKIRNMYNPYGSANGLPEDLHRFFQGSLGASFN